MTGAVLPFDPPHPSRMDEEVMIDTFNAKLSERVAFQGRIDRKQSPVPHGRIDWIKTAGLILAFAINLLLWGGAANLLMHLGG